MIDFNVSTDRYAQFINASLRINGVDKKKATSPDTLLERVIDFLTLGKLHERFATEYDNFTAAVTKAIADNNKAQGYYTIPHALTLDYEGHRVSFTPKQHDMDNEPTMIIEIAGATEKKEISQNRYKNFCTLQLLRETNALRSADISLTEHGVLDLKNANLAGLSLSGIDLSLAILSHANFTNSDLSGADLRGALCQETNLKCANLQGAWCQEANFKGADFQGALCQNIHLAGADLRDIAIARTDSVLQLYLEKADKKRTKVISALCDKIKKVYEKDSNGNIEHDCNGLFKIQAVQSKVNDAIDCLNRGVLDIEKVSLKVASSLIRREFKAKNPIDQKTYDLIRDNPGQALQLFLDRFSAMAPETGKRCQLILETYAAVYDNADDDNASKSNKDTVIRFAAGPSLLDTYYTLSDTNSKSTRYFSERILNDLILRQKATPIRHRADDVAAMRSAEQIQFAKSRHLVEPMHSVKPIQSAEPTKYASAYQDITSNTLLEPIFPPVASRVSADVIVVDANESSRHTRVNYANDDENANKLAQGTVPVSNIDDNTLSGPRRANKGDPAGTTAASRISVGTMTSVIVTKSVSEIETSLAARGEVKQKRSETHDATMIDAKRRGRVREIIAFYEGRGNEIRTNN